MVLTSQSFNVSAAMQDDLLAPEDAVISAETVEGSESLTDDADNLTVETEELSVDEEALSEELLIEDELQPTTEDVLVEGNEEVEGETAETTEPVVTAAVPEQPEGDYTDILSINIVGGKRVLCMRDPSKKLSDYTSVKTVYIPSNVDIIPKDEALFWKNQTVTNILFGTAQTKDLSGNEVINATISSNLVIEESAFEDSGIESFVSPVNYKTVIANTFKGSRKLSTFDFKNIENIENGAFYGCKLLGNGEVTWHKNIKNIGNSAFYDTGFVNLNLSSMIKETGAAIGESAFAACTGLKTVTVPAVISEIPKYCFDGCTALETINVAQSVAGTIIYDYAFRGCTKLVKIGENAKDNGGKNNFMVQTIGISAFSGCTELKTLILPNSVKTVSENAFENCKKITSIEFWYKSNTGYADDIEISETAFPTEIAPNATMAGCDGRVKEYAVKDTHKYKKYISLIADYKIVAQDKDGKSGGFGTGKTIKAVVKGSNPEIVDKAKPGDEVLLKVTPRSKESSTAWRLRRNDLYDTNNGLTVDDIVFISGDDKGQTFEFKMPYNDVEINTQGKFYQDSWIKEGTHTGLIGAFGNEGTKFVKDGDTWYAQHPLCKAQVYVNANVASGTHAGDYKLGQWMFEYKSSNENVATVSEYGVIDCKAAGDAKITATYRGDNNWKVEIPINVGPMFDLHTLSANAVNNADNLKGITADWQKKIINGDEYMCQVLTIDKDDVSTADRSIKLEAIGKNKDTGNTAYVTSHATWSLGESTIGKLEHKKTGNEDFYILTIAKGSAGYARIKVTYNTHRKDKDDKDIILTSYIYVNVQDATPRVTMGDIVVNTNKDSGWEEGSVNVEGGTPITITPAAGYTINESSLLIVKGANRSATDLYTGLRLKRPGETADGMYHLIFNRSGADSGLGADTGVGKSKTYTGKTQLWISGEYNENKKKFVIPLSKVTIKNEPLKLDTKMNGNINLWYTASCYYPINDDESINIIGCYDELERKTGETVKEYRERYKNATVGEVKVINNIPFDTAEVDDWVALRPNVQLWSVDHYKEWKRGNTTQFYENGTIKTGIADPFVDKLNNNFEVFVDDRDGTNEKDFVIQRSANDLSPNGVEVKNGKEYDVTKGYLAVYFKGYSKPALQAITVPTSATAPAYVLSETSIYENEKNTSGEFRFKIMNNARTKTMVSSNTATHGNKSIYVDTTQGNEFISAVFDGEDVVLTASTGLHSGKKTAVIKVRKDNWGKAATYKYTVNYVDKVPTAKLKASTLKTNKWYKDAAVETELALNQANCTLTIDGNKFTYTGSDKLSGDAGKITITVDKSADSVKNYKNKLIISAKFTNPSDTPQKGTYRFTFTPQYKWGTGAVNNMKPMNISIQVVDNQPTVKLSSSAYTFNMYYPDMEVKDVVAKFGNLPMGVAAKDLNIDTSKAKLVFYKSSKDSDIKDKVRAAVKITNKYDKDKKKWMFYVKMNEPSLKNRDFNITYDIEDLYLNNTKIKPVRVTIKGINKEPTVKVSASGTLNVIDYTSVIKYNTKFNNLVNPELSTTQGIMVRSVSTDQISTILKAEQDKDKPNIINVTLKPGAEFSNRDYKNYEFRLEFRVRTNDQTLDIKSKNIKIKPVQKTPNIKTKIDNWAKKAVFYTGVRDNVRYKDIELTKTSNIKTHITKIKIADSNSTLLEEAFEIKDDGYNYPWYWSNGWIQENTLNRAIDRYNSLDKSVKKLNAGTVRVYCTNPHGLKSGKTYNLILEAEFDGQLYKTDSNGNFVLDKNGKKIKIKGSTFKVPVVVYN